MDYKYSLKVSSPYPNTLFDSTLDSRRSLVIYIVLKPAGILWIYIIKILFRVEQFS